MNIISNPKGKRSNLTLIFITLALIICPNVLSAGPKYHTIEANDLLESLDYNKIIERHFINQELAERVAYNFIKKNNELKGEIYRCIYLPGLDINSNIIFHHFIYSNSNKNVGYNNLIPRVSEYISVLNESTDGTAEITLRKKHQMSVGEFYTVSISAFNFHHPINKAHAGLPRWILEFEEIQDICEKEIRPSAIIPLREPRKAVEIIEYYCSGEKVLFSHYVNKIFEANEFKSSYDVTADYNHWQRKMLKKYNVDVRMLANDTIKREIKSEKLKALYDRIDRINQIWLMYVQ